MPNGQLHPAYSYYHEKPPMSSMFFVLALPCRATPRPARPHRAPPRHANPGRAGQRQALPGPALPRQSNGRDSHPPVCCSLVSLPCQAMPRSAWPSPAGQRRALPRHAQPSLATLVLPADKLIAPEVRAKRAQAQCTAHCKRLPQVLKRAIGVLLVLYHELQPPG